MSPWTKAERFDGPRFPRVSGDEPTATTPPTAGTWFSPRERG